jgi:protein-S-isoprenylcysteine O-methyltransferase Ste14
MGAPGAFVGFCWAALILVWAISALSVKRTKERQPLFSRLLYVWLLAVMIVLLTGRIHSFHLDRTVLPPTLGTAIAADVIVFAGFVLALWARLALGTNWSSRVALKENHELIQRGPYRLVRHPIYSGLLLMILGTAVLAGQLQGFVALLISFLGFWIKLRQEEALLTKRLPGYSEYMARTKTLVPFLL